MLLVVVAHLVEKFVSNEMLVVNYPNRTRKTPTVSIPATVEFRIMSARSCHINPTIVQPRVPVIDKIKSSSCGPPAAREVIAIRRMAVLAHLMYQLTSLYGVILVFMDEYTLNFKTKNENGEKDKKGSNNYRIL